MTSSPVRVRIDRPSATVVLQRPERRNALSYRLLVELQTVLNELLQQRRVRAVILTGAGSAFCAGLDLKEMRESGPEDAGSPRGDDLAKLCELIDTMLHFPKPIIAAVNGPAVAAGAGLVLASDIVLGTPSAELGLPEPRRGLAAGVVAPLLAFRAGGGLAANLLLTGRSMPAREAHRWGLYHEVVPTHLVWARAHEVAAQCADAAPDALTLTKRMLNETIGQRLAPLLADGAVISRTARATEAANEGIAAFFQRREPSWPS
jgi:enoyl-CoA hydratase/carnithine racemase